MASARVGQSIPAKNVEVNRRVPPMLSTTPILGMDSDWQFLVKYRIAAQNEEHGNYILTAFFGDESSDWAVRARRVKSRHHPDD
jgi:hypothetical protein